MGIAAGGSGSLRPATYSGRDRVDQFLLAVVLVAATVAVYFRVATFDFVALDDAGYVFQNPHVLRGLTLEGIRWAFTTTSMGNWHPLTWLSLMLDVAVAGSEPGVFHVTNVLLHVLNTLLLFHLLTACTGLARRAAFVAIVFAVHPLHVESVAWISERKDVLCALFGLLALVAYRRYVERPGAGRYVAVALPLALGLMAKPMLVSLPLLMLLMDRWPFGRWRRANDLRALVVEKLPLAALSVAASATTIWAQAHERAVVGLGAIPLDARIANAAASYAWYLWKTIWPSSLACSYPYSLTGRPGSAAAASGVLLIVISAGVVRYARRFPYLEMGWLWYVVSLVPVIGLVQVGIQPRADRYMYLPMVGLLIAFAWGASDLFARFAASRVSRAAAASAAAASVIALIAAAHTQTGTWKNSLLLYTHAVRVSPDSATAHDGLGFQSLQAGHVKEALTELETAVRLMPVYPEAHVNLGAALVLSGRRDEALAQYREAVRLRPGDPWLEARLGTALVIQGQLEEGVGLLQHAVGADTLDGNAVKFLGTALAELGRDDEAAARLRQAAGLLPRDTEVRVRLGVLDVRRRQPSEAETAFREALGIEADNTAAHRGLGTLLAMQGRYPEAITHLEAALKSDPSNEGTRLNLERARRMASGSP